MERLEPIGKVRRGVEPIAPVERRREEARDGGDPPRRPPRRAPAPPPPDDGRPHVDVRA